MISPICLFTYNRLFETQQTIAALQKNDLARESDLYIFSDGAKNAENKAKVDEVRNYLNGVNGFKSISIISSIENKGLAGSIISGVTQILKQFNSVIVLEDDLVTAPFFLNFMNQALNFYSEERQIQSVSGYSLSLKDKSKPVYFHRRPGSWGWGTWTNRWNENIFDKDRIKTILAEETSLIKKFKNECGNDIDSMLMNSINNRNDSWYVRWVFDHFLQRHYSVFPTYSYVENIGFNSLGTHCKGINTYISVPIAERNNKLMFPEFQIPDADTNKEILSYFTLWHKIRVRLKLITKKSGRILLWEELKNRTSLLGKKGRPATSP